MIYLAGAIDTKGTEGWVADLWRLEAHRSLIEAGEDVYDPAGVYWPGIYGGAERAAREIWEGNQQALEHSKGLLALLPPGVRTIGTPMEIQSALGWEIPTVVIAEEYSTSLAGAGIKVYAFRHLATAIESLLLAIRKDETEMEMV